MGGRGFQEQVFQHSGTLSCMAASPSGLVASRGLGLRHFVKITLRGSEMSSVRSGSSIRGSTGLAVGLL